MWQNLFFRIDNLQIFDNLLTDRDWEGKNSILLKPYTFFPFLEYNEFFISAFQKTY